MLIEISNAFILFIDRNMIEINNTVNKTVITDEINIILQDLVFFSPDRPYHFTKDGLGP